ncbi:S24 family peptidase [soil metagenome]
MPEPLTELERRVLDYLVEYLRSNTYQPSIREIGREFTIKSTKTVSELLQSLADKGWIERDPSRSRGVRLIGLEMRAETVSVPVFEEPENPHVAGHYEMDRKLVASSGAWLLMMEGDHLLEDGIRAGDLLLVETGRLLDFRSGDLVVVKIGATTSVRRCSKTEPNIVLEPTRLGETPQTLSPRQVHDVIQGRVTSVVRRLRPLSEQPARGITPATG